MDYDADLNFNYFAPTKVLFGKGALSDLPCEVTRLGSKAVLVTDPGLIATGMVEQVKSLLGSSLAGVYADIPQDLSLIHI